MAGPFIPGLIARGLGLDQALIQNLPYGARGIASLVLNPYSTAASYLSNQAAKSDVQLPGPLQTIANLLGSAESNRQYAGEQIRRGLADQLPQQLGDILAPERKFDEPIRRMYEEVEMGPYLPYQKPPMSPHEELRGQIFETLNEYPPALRGAILDKYVSGEATFPDNYLAERILTGQPAFYNAPPEFNPAVDSQEAASYLNLPADFGDLPDFALQEQLDIKDFANLGMDASQLSAPDVSNFGAGDFGFGNFDLGDFGGSTGGGYFGGSDDYYTMDLFARGGKVRA